MFLSLRPPGRRPQRARFYLAEPGSTDADALHLLGTAAADEERRARHR